MTFQSVALISVTLTLLTLPAAAFQPTCFSSGRHCNDVTHHPSRSCCLSAALNYLDDSSMNDLLFRPGEGRPRSVLVDACTAWCGPCKLIEPYLINCGEWLHFKFC
jgi:thiol:disulfide interchange protein